jgi:hypothetical protein
MNHSFLTDKFFNIESFTQSWCIYDGSLYCGGCFCVKNISHNKSSFFFDLRHYSVSFNSISKSI